MGGYEEFDRRLSQREVALLRRVGHERLVEALTAAWESKPFDLPELTGEELFYMEVGRRFWEVRASFEALRQIPVYLRFFPRYRTWARHGITRIRYLRHHIERYLEENYVLRERVEAFLDWLGKALGEAQLAESASAVAQVKKKFLRSTKKLARDRGMHVHEKRYSDEELRRIEAIDLASSHDDGFVPVADQLGCLASRVWRQRIRESNTAVQQELDAVFREVGPLVFAE